MLFIYNQNEKQNVKNSSFVFEKISHKIKTFEKKRTEKRRIFSPIYESEKFRNNFQS